MGPFDLHSHEVQSAVRIVDTATLAAGQINEDRAGAASSLAWVIDGATDVIDVPLTATHSDASWIAETLDRHLRGLALELPAELVHLPAILAERLEAEFQRVAKRQPAGRQEYPSAAGLIIRAEDSHLDYVAVGDCSLIISTPVGVRRVGVEDGDAGDVWVSDIVREIQGRYSDAALEHVRAHLWPRLRTARAAMNEPDGYGVFSLTPPPLHFIKCGTEQVACGGRVLLATDGLMRLVDVFHRYSAETLLAAASEQGVSSLLMQVRALENEDHECRRFPRAKCHDDATGVLLELVPGR